MWGHDYYFQTTFHSHVVINTKHYRYLLSKAMCLNEDGNAHSMCKCLFSVLHVSSTLCTLLNQECHHKTVI